MLPSSRLNHHVFFSFYSVKLLFLKRLCSLLNQNEKVTCDNGGTQTTKPNFARHKKRCSVGTLFCTHCRNLSTKSQIHLNDHNAKEHGAPKPDVTFRCILRYQGFPGFCALRQHKNSQHGFPIKTANADPDGIINEGVDANLKEELRSCQHFLIDSELKRARHKVFTYAKENLNAKIVDEKLDLFFNNFKCAAKVNLAFGLILKNLEDGEFRKM